MKKFITRIPIQIKGNLVPTAYTAMGNSKLQLDRATCFPITTAINGYVQEGEEFEIYALGCDTENENANFDVLCSEIDALCKEKNIVCKDKVKKITIDSDQSVLTQTKLFQTLIQYIDDDDELFACMTFGTKPQSQVIIMALQYAYRIKNNASFGAIVYGERDHKTGEGKVYDMTALIQLDEVVRVLAEQCVENPQEMIKAILEL